MADQQVSLVLVQQRLQGQHHGQVLAHLVGFQTGLDLQVLERLPSEDVVEGSSSEVLGREEALLEASQRQVGEEVAGVSLEVVVFEGVVGEEGVGSEGQVADGDAAHEEDVPLGKSEHVLLHLGGSGFALLLLGLLEAEDFVDWRHDAAEDVVFGDDVGKCGVAVDDDELVHVLIVPDDLVHSVGHQIEVVVGLRGGEEEIGLSILVLQDDLGAVFVGEDAEDGVVGLVLHYHVFVFDVVVLESGGVVEVDEEHFGEEKLHYLPVALHREHLLLGLLCLYLHQVQFVLVVEQGSPAVSHLHSLDVVLALNLVDFFAAGDQHFVPEPAVELDCVAQARCQVVGAQRYARGLEGQVDVVDELSLLL